MVLAILMYEQFIHYTQINLYPNTQVLNIQQRTYRSFSSLTSRFDSVCIIMARWVTLRQNVCLGT